MSQTNSVLMVNLGMLDLIDIGEPTTDVWIHNKIMIWDAMILTYSGFRTYTPQESLPTVSARALALAFAFSLGFSLGFALLLASGAACQGL